MRQRYWKLTPDGRNSDGRLVWRDRTQAGTRQGEDVREERKGCREAACGCKGQGSKSTEWLTFALQCSNLLSGFLSCDRPFLGCMYGHGRIVAFCCLCRSMGKLNTPVTSRWEDGMGLVEAGQGDPVKYFPYTFNFDAMLFVLFWNSLEGLSDLNLALWRESEERN